MAGRLPGLFGVELVDLERGLVRARLAVRAELLAPNEFLHAGTVVTLADTCCGVGCQATLPQGATGFTTLELKTSFVRTAGEGETLLCEARAVHEGRTTQLWDATVARESDGKPIGLFRCTQYLLRAG